jgi:phage gp36-like protein
VYAKHQLKLLKSVAKKDYIDDRRVYKSLASAKHVCTADTDAFFENRYSVSADEARDLLSRCLTANLTDCVNYSLLDVFTQQDL